MTNIIYKKEFSFGTYHVFDSMPSFPMVWVSQCHGDNIVSEENSGSSADGIYTLSPKSFPPLAIKTADCLPIIVIGEHGLALIHAGWRGIKGHIFLNDKIINLNPNYFFIGPHICSRCFEVGQDFYENFPSSKNFISKKDHLYFNLEAEVRENIKDKFPLSKVESSHICTYENSRFHSFRRNKTTMRNWNIISDKSFKA